MTDFYTIVRTTSPRQSCFNFGFYFELPFEICESQYEEDAPTSHVPHCLLFSFFKRKKYHQATYINAASLTGQHSSHLLHSSVYTTVSFFFYTALSLKLVITSSIADSCPLQLWDVLLPKHWALRHNS